MECIRDKYTDVLCVVQSCINSKKNGVLLIDLNSDFKNFYGSDIPYEEFGFPTLKSYLQSLPNVYVVTDDHKNRERVIFASSKSQHITKLVNSTKRDRCLISQYYNTVPSINSSFATTVSAQQEEFSRLQSMLPLFYNRQALGDDFMVDIADTAFGYYVSPNGPYQCGLCVCNQTIEDLSMRIQNVPYLAPKVIVMIGMADILQARLVKKCGIKSRAETDVQ